MPQGILGNLLVDQLEGMCREQALTGEDLLAVDHPHKEAAIATGCLPRPFIIGQNTVHGFGGVLENQATGCGDRLADSDIKLGNDLFHEQIVDLFGGEGAGFRLMTLL